MEDNAIPRSNDPGEPVPQPQGAQGRDQHLGLGAAALAAAPLMGFQLEGARRSASAGNAEAYYTSNQPNGSVGLDADPRGTRLEAERGLATWAWPATSAVDSPPWEATEDALAEDAGANHTIEGSDGPPRAWGPGVPDHGGDMSVARRDRARPAGAYAPVGMHVALDAEEAYGVSHGPRHEPRGRGVQWYYDSRWHFAPPPSDKAYGAPDEGALEGERLGLQSRALLTPAALGVGAQAGVVPGARALHTCEPPALHGTHKHAARRESVTLPQRAVGEETDARDDLPVDKGDHYVALHGESHGPERRPGYDEVAEVRAEIERICAQVQTLQDKRRRRDLESETSELFDTIESDSESSDSELAAIRAALTAAAARQQGQGRHGDVGDPAANPVHHPSSGRVSQPRAAEQSAPPSAAACIAGRETGGPLYGAAAPGGGGRPHLQSEAGPRRAPPAPGLQCQPHGTPPRDRSMCELYSRAATLAAPRR